ncbi:hypothetical protein Tco_0491272 [Tanacetum coccineum]
MKIKELSMVKLNARCSAVLQNDLPPKEKDIGSFVLPCIIGTSTVSNALVDLGAIISVYAISKRYSRECSSKIHKFIFPVDFVILDVIKDDKVSIILRRPMLATAHARIDVLRGKISLEVGTKHIIFNANEGAIPSTFSHVCVINDYDIIDDSGGPEDLVELLMNNDINGDLGDFLPNNDLQPNFDAPKVISLSRIDDIWDDLDPGVLTNNIVNPPLKPEFFTVGNRIHRHNPYNLQITCKIGFMNVNPYIDPHSPFNIMFRAAYNSVMKQELIYTGNNIAGIAKNLHVFVGCHMFLINFIILENVNEFVEKGLTEVLFDKPFKENIGLEEDINKGVLWFKIRDDKTIFNMPRAERKLGKLTTEQHNMMFPILKVYDEDKAKGVCHPFQKIKEFYRGCSNSGDEYKQDQEVIDWIKRGHASVHEMT